jgi:hypothetical protein
MAGHRVKTLSTVLPIALATGYREVEPDCEPLKVLSFIDKLKWFLTKNLEL